MKILLISGANSATSRLTGFMNYIEQTISNHSIDVDRVDVISIPAEDLILTNFSSAAIQGARKKVEEADVLFIATPVYKGAYSGILKTFLDLLPERALAGKVCVPIAMGGTVAHLLMLEYTLKPVLSILGATTIQHGIFALDKQVTFVGGSVAIDEDLVERVEETIGVFQKVHV